MKKQYFLKDKKAHIYKKIDNGQDEAGFSLPISFHPTTKHPVWCYTRQLTQNQIFTAMAYGQEETRLFMFNFRTDIAMYDIIYYRNEWYEVTRIDTKDDYNGDLFVYVKAYSGGTPADEQIEPYEPEEEAEDETEGEEPSEEPVEEPGSEPGEEPGSEPVEEP